MFSERRLIKMKILQLPPGYPPEIGGVENSVYQVVKRMQSLGHQVTVITANPSSTKNFKACSLPEARRLPVLLSVQGNWGDVKFCPTIIRELRAVDFDIAHAHTPRKFFAESLALYKLLSRRKFPYVVSVRLINMSLPAFFRAVNNVYRKTIERLVFRNAARIVVQSKANKHFLMEVCGLSEEKIVIIPNGIDTIFFGPVIKKKRNQRQAHKLTERIILFVGRLTSQKGLDFLLEAFVEVQKTVPNARLMVVGDGPMRSHFIKMAERLKIGLKVTFLGSVAYEEMPQLYSISDIFVMPSLSESFPNALLEAMAMKKAIVSTKVGVIPEMLKARETALLVNPRETKELENAILHFLGDERLSLRLGENARKLAVEEYSWESVVARTLSMYEQVLSEEASEKRVFKS